ncbi:MAG: stage II sporulation protein P [Bacillota bacterium]
MKGKNFGLLILAAFLWGLVLAGTPTASDVPTVILYHSHTSESFLPDLYPDPAERESKDPNEYGFSLDSDLNVTKVGRELAAALTHLGIRVHHNTQFHDLGTRAGRESAYARSLVTLWGMLQLYPDAAMVIDLHRDASSHYATVQGEVLPRVLLIVGDDNPGWQKNLAFAQRVSDRINTVYPGLSKDVRVLDARFNQHLHPRAFLMEIGGVNTRLEECVRTARLIAPVLAEVAREVRQEAQRAK